MSPRTTVVVGSGATFFDSDWHAATAIAIVSKEVRRKDIADLVNGGTCLSDRRKVGPEGDVRSRSLGSKAAPPTGGAATYFHSKVRGEAMSRCAPVDHFLLIGERYDNKAF